MNDLISRSGTIRELVKLHEETGVKTAQAIRIVREMPEAVRWIPCSERLPEEEGWYLVTGKTGKVYSIGYRKNWWYGGAKPIAWMPLPEGYQGD